MINLNKQILNIDNYDFGDTQNIEVKLGQKLYMLDLRKNSESTTIDMYRRLNSDRNNYSKYDADLVTVRVKNDSILRRDFFENIKDIAFAKAIYSKYSYLK